MVAIKANRASGPEIRMTAIAAGGRPDDRAKIVSCAVLKIAGLRNRIEEGELWLLVVAGWSSDPVGHLRSTVPRTYSVP